MAVSVRIEDEAFADSRIEHLAALLGTSRYDALGRMAFIWRQCTQEGTYHLAQEIIELYVPAGALVTSRLAENTPAGIRIKGTKGRIEWLRKARKSAQKGGLSRAKSASRAAGKFTAKNQPTAGDDTSPPAPSPVTAPAPSPAPVQEEENQEHKDTCTEPPKAAASVPEATVIDLTTYHDEPTAEPAILIFPTVGKDAKEWGLTQSVANDLQGAFPCLPVLAEARKALEWCRANPAKRKTPQGMRRFLFGWMERAQNGRGGEKPSLDDQIKANGLEFMRRMQARDAR